MKDNYGCTELMLKNAVLTIIHRGNMGNTIKRSVDPNLKAMGWPTIGELKEMFPDFNEEGSPDYYYEIKFQIPLA